MTFLSFGRTEEETLQIYSGCPPDGNLLHISVGVQTAEEKVDAEICEEDAAEPDDGQPCHTVAAPSLHGACMEESGIYQPGNQRPCLFGIPAPISAPR